MKKTKPKPVVLNDIEATPEILASAIRDVAIAAKKLIGGPLSKRAIWLLIRDQTSLSLNNIASVLDAAANLDTYIVKRKESKQELP